MPIYAKAGPSYEVPPADSYPAVCIDVVDLGNLPGFGGKPAHKIKIVWQLAAQNSEGRPFRVSRRYTCSLHEKATLRKDLESWRGRPFTPAEQAGFDVETVISVPCLLNVIHNVKDGSTFANVSTVMRLPKELKAPEIEAGYIREKDRPKDVGADDPGNYDGDPGFDSVPF